MALPRIRSRRVGTFAVKSGQLASVAKIYPAASDCRIPRLKLDDRQARNHLEVAEIARGYAVAEF